MNIYSMDVFFFYLTELSSSVCTDFLCVSTSQTDPESIRKLSAIARYVCVYVETGSNYGKMFSSDVNLKMNIGR